jgi:hypothetical protein
MTAFSDFPAPPEHPLHPDAEQVHQYLHAYAGSFGVIDRIRFDSRVADVRRGWELTASALMVWCSPRAGSASRTCPQRSASSPES